MRRAVFALGALAAIGGCEHNPVEPPLPDLLLQVTAPGALAVAIDVLPKDADNAVNLRSGRPLPVAILTDGAFDATTIDPATARFGPAGAIAERQWHLRDVDRDGDTDLLLRFRTQDAGLDCADAVAVLMAQTLDGQVVEGADAVAPGPCGPPIAYDDEFEMAKNTVLTGNVLEDNGTGPDVAAEGEPLAVDPTPVTPPAHGTLALAADGAFTYTPDTDFLGTDGFQYQLVGGTAFAGVGQVTIEVIESPCGAGQFVCATLRQTGSGVNTRVPLEMLEDDILIFQLTAFPERADLVFTVEQLLPIPQLTGVLYQVGADNVTQGDAILSVAEPVLVTNPDHLLMFVPAPNYNGVAEFVYRVTDPTHPDDPAYTDDALSGILVLPVNDAPFPLGDNHSHGATSPFSGEPTVTRVTLSFGDPDGGGHTIFIRSLPPFGTLYRGEDLVPEAEVTLGDNDSFLLAPAHEGSVVFKFVSPQDSVGTWSFFWEVQDDSAASSGLIEHFISVVQRNQIPVPSYESNLSTPEDSPLLFQLNATDPDGPANEIVLIPKSLPDPAIGTFYESNSNGEQLGELLVNGAIGRFCFLGNCEPWRVLFVPAPDVSDAVAEMEFVFADKETKLDQTGIPVETVSVAVTPVNDAPVLVDNGGSRLIPMSDPQPLALAGLSLTDDAVPGDILSVDVQATFADSVFISDPTGLASYTVVDATEPTHIVFTGTLAVINEVFANALLVFAPQTDPALTTSETAVVTVTVDDQGAHGVGGPLSDTLNIEIFLSVDSGTGERTGS